MRNGPIISIALTQVKTDEWGNICHLRNGQLHREGAPAYESAKGTRIWYLNGSRHRTDGPATILSNGYEEWWIDGEYLSQEEFEALTQ